MAANYNGLLSAGVPDMVPDTKKAGAGLFAEMGILSPSEKIQMQLQQQQAMQAQFALQQQLAAQAQQMQLGNAQAKAGVPQGLGFSQFMAMGGLQNIQNADRLASPYAQGGTRAAKGNAPASMRTPNFFPDLPSAGADQAGIDPGSILTEAMQKYPTKSEAFRVAGRQIASLGAARQDAYLQNVGTNLMNAAAKAEEEEAELEGKRATTAKTRQDTILEKAKASRPGDYQNRRDASGNILTDRDFFDENGKYIGTKTVGAGPNRQITEDGTPLTKTQFGDSYGKFGDLLKNSQTSLKAMDDIAASLESGAKVGWAGSAVTLLDNAIGTLKQLAPDATLTAGATARITELNSTFDEIAAKTGIAKSQIVDLTSSLAKTYNPTGTITEKDITRAADAVGGGASSPKTMAAVLRSAGARTVEGVDTAYEYADPEVQKAVKGQYDHFKTKWGHVVPKKTKSEARRGKVKSGPNAGKTIIEYTDGSKEYK